MDVFFYGFLSETNKSSGTYNPKAFFIYETNFNPMLALKIMKINKIRFQSFDSP